MDSTAPVIMPVGKGGSQSDLAYLYRVSSTLADAFRYIEKYSGIGEGFSNQKQCQRSIIQYWDTTFVALDASLDNVLGVVVATPDDKGAVVYCVALIGVSPKVMRGGIGRKLMTHVDEVAKAQGKTSVRLTVNQHSKQSLPFYISMGFETKETVGLMTDGPDYERPERPPKLKGFQFEMISTDTVDEVCTFMDKIVGFSRKQDLLARVNYRGNILMRNTDTNEIVAFTVGEYSAADNEDFWMYITQQLLATTHNVPEILVPNRHPKLVNWFMQMGMKVYKGMYLMVKGEYQVPKGIYCPSCEY